MKTCQSVFLTLSSSLEQHKTAEITVMLNPYFSHVHVERYFLNRWPVRCIDARGWSSGRSQRESVLQNYHSVAFHDILYVEKTHNPPSCRCPPQPWIVSQLPLHNSFSLTFIGNVWGGKLSLDDFTATNLWIQRWFYRTTQTLLFHCCDMLENLWWAVWRNRR